MIFLEHNTIIINYILIAPFLLFILLIVYYVPKSYYQEFIKN